MFRKALYIAGLQLRLEMRDRSSFIWLLLVPIIFTTLVGAAFGGFGAAAPAPRVPIAFIDLDKSSASAVFGQALRSESSLDVQTPSETDARQQLRDNRIPVLVVIPAGFGAAVENGTKVNVELVRSAGTSSGYFLEQLVRNAAARVSTLAYAATVTTDQLARWEVLDGKARLAAWKETFQTAATSLSSKPTVVTDYMVLARTQPRVQLPDNQTQSSTGFGVMFVMAGVLGMATTLVSERLRNTLSRLLTTPLSVLAFLEGKLIAMMTLGILQFTLFILWGRFVLGVDWGRAPAAVLVMVAVYVFAAAGVGVLVGSLCRTMAQAGVIATFVTYGSSMLAGSWWPVEIMPPFMQRMARIFPQYWAVNGFNKIIVRGLDFSSLGPNILVLTLTGALCLVAGSVIFGRNAHS